MARLPKRKNRRNEKKKNANASRVQNVPRTFGLWKSTERIKYTTELKYLNSKCRAIRLHPDLVANNSFPTYCSAWKIDQVEFEFVSYMSPLAGHVGCVFFVVIPAKGLNSRISADEAESLQSAILWDEKGRLKITPISGPISRHPWTNLSQVVTPPQIPKGSTDGERQDLQSGYYLIFDSRKLFGKDLVDKQSVLGELSLTITATYWTSLS
ncbi:coat protein [Ourmia melon virus]|uniref:Capsid protein n=1 Tax=Ourmia melon virus (isolate Melon/Iran/VE9) TaxID=652838 RepID=CAPSD_OUMVV|nr:coat protein [Ourmia melon virus]B3VML3.1 RecName: Full=Capsid protein; Short=CP; AltName: Full=Coat protein [Ourmia melon virus VE9]ACF16362.1 coat protein [Ourmia melon virus]